MKKYTIGVDLGGTTITAGIVDENCRVVRKCTCDTELPQPETVVEEKIAGLCRRVLQENDMTLDDIRWVGIGTPGSVDSRHGVVDFNANFGYFDWELRAHMEQLLGCEVHIENDANAAAYGEYIAGGAQGAKYAVVITLGTGIGEDFDLSHLKYNKVIILSDADQDGAHIRAILLTFFYRYMRGLITDGHVYIGMPPLYKVAKGENVQYCYDDKELAGALKKVGKGYTLQRYKGLGEMNPEQLWETTMNPNGRMLMQVSIEDNAEAEHMVTVLMGDKVEPRKEYIFQYADFNKKDNFEPVTAEGSR